MKKKSLHMPSSYTTLFIIIALVAVMTWVVPAGQYDYVDPEADKPQPIAGTFQEAEQNPQGLWEVAYAPVAGVLDSIDIAIYILVLGGYLAVIMKSGSIDAGVGAVIKKLKGREYLLIPVLMFLFSLGGTTFGMWEETMGFYLILIPVFIAAGYDSLTGVLVVALGAGLGTLGSTVNPFATGIASGFAGISIGDGLPLRLLIYAVVLAIGIFFVMRYAAGVKKDPKRSLVYDQKTENERHFLGAKPSTLTPMTGKHKVILGIFGFTFLMMILAVIPWADKFGVTIFEDMVTSVAAIPVLGKLVGGLVPLGNWWFAELAVLFMVSAVITGFISCKSEKEFFDTFIGGAQDLLGVVMIIGISRGITTVMNAGGMTASVLHLGEELLTGVSKMGFSILSFLFYLPLSFFVPSSSGLATLSMPIIAPLADFIGVGRDLAVTSFQSANGLVNLITPTSGVLMGALTLGRIPYDRYVRFILKLLLALCVAIMAMLALAVML